MVGLSRGHSETFQAIPGPWIYTSEIRPRPGTSVPPYFPSTSPRGNSPHSRCLTPPPQIPGLGTPWFGQLSSSVTQAWLIGSGTRYPLTRHPYWSVAGGPWQPGVRVVSPPAPARGLRWAPPEAEAAQAGWGHWSPTLVMPGRERRRLAGTSQRFRASLRVAAGPDFAESASGPWRGGWRLGEVRGVAGGGRWHPRSRLRLRRGAPAGSRRSGRLSPERLPAAAVAASAIPALGITPGGRPKARSGFQEAGGGAFQPSLAVAAAPRAPSGVARPLTRSVRAPSVPCTGGRRGVGARAGRRPCAPCTCRAVQVAARALRLWAPASALLRTPGGGGRGGAAPSQPHLTSRRRRRLRRRGLEASVGEGPGPGFRTRC